MKIIKIICDSLSKHMHLQHRKSFEQYTWCPSHFYGLLT